MSILNFRNTKLTKMVSFLFIAFIIDACNNNNATKETDNKEKVQLIDSSNMKKELDSSFACAGMENLIVEPSEGMKMIGLFAEHYRREKTPNPIQDLVKEVWIDSCVITALADFFEANTQYDGVRFYAGAENSKKSTIILIPTKPINAPGHGHEDVYNITVPIKANCNPGFKNLNLPKQLFDIMKNKFGGDFRHETTPGNRHTASLDSLSVSVWMGECVFKALRDIIRANSTLLDGINVNFAAYNVLDNVKHPGQLYKYQSTIVIVPTEPSTGGRHKNNWDVIKKSSFFKTFFPGGYNHGELCPDDCP